MKHFAPVILYVLPLLIFIPANSKLHAVAAPDVSFIQRKLIENKYFFRFINISVSNFGDDEDKAMLLKAARLNYSAHKNHLKGEYDAAFVDIRSAHLALKKLYDRILWTRYLVDTRKILDASSPIVVGSRDKRAEKLLRLGYRDLVESARILRTARNINRFLYSTKVRQYIDAIKLARQGKRYAMLALIECRTTIEDKKDFQVQTIDEALNPTPKIIIPDFNRVKNLLTNMLNRKLLENFYDFFTHHYDNYGYTQKRNYLESVSEKVTAPEEKPESK